MKCILLLFFFYSLTANAQEQKNITLLDKWSDETLVTNSSLVRYNDCWGFTRNGKEYAILGSTEGTHFFELTNDYQIKACGFIEGKFNSSMVVHRDFKVFGNYAYSVCDEGSSSLQIIDLSYLPDSVVKVADIQNADFGKTHNIFIDTTNALLYACSVTPIVGGIPLSKIPMRVFSLSDPVNPIFIWEGPSDIPEVHDIYVRDNIGILNCGFDGLRVYDFTNPSSPNYLSNLTIYQDQGYNHQGWLSPDGKTYIFGDETGGKRLKKCTVNPDNTIQIKQYFGTNYLNNSVPHNIMCTNEFAFVAYYNEGLRIYDIRNAAAEIASYDTYPQISAFNMNGAWGVFSNYSSGRIIVSDRQNGLFLFHFDQSVFLNSASDEFSIYPNPSLSSSTFTIRALKDEISEFTIKIYNCFGEILATESIANYTYVNIKTPVISGIYFIRIEYVDYLGEIVLVDKKLIVE